MENNGIKWENDGFYHLTQNHIYLGGAERWTQDRQMQGYAHANNGQKAKCKEWKTVEVCNWRQPEQTATNVDTNLITKTQKCRGFFKPSAKDCDQHNASN